MTGDSAMHVEAYTALTPGPHFLLGILGQLDTRLVKLDKTIAPFGIQPLSKEAQSKSNVHKAALEVPLSYDGTPLARYRKRTIHIRRQGRQDQDHQERVCCGQA